MKNRNKYQGKSGAPDGECCVKKRSTTRGVGEVQIEKEEYQIYAEERRKRRGQGVRNEIEEHRKRSSEGVPNEIEQCRNSMG
jgi:hypothetical protein